MVDNGVEAVRADGMGIGGRFICRAAHVVEAGEKARVQWAAHIELASS